MSSYFVINRQGVPEPFDFNKTKAKLSLLAGQDLKVDVDKLVIQVMTSIKPGISTSEIDLLSAKLCWLEYETSFEYDYSVLAYRIIRSDMSKSYPNLEGYLKVAGLLPEVEAKIRDLLRKVNLESQDWEVTYMSLICLKSTHLTRSGGNVIEKPEYMLARVACALSDNPSRTYSYMASGLICFATPILCNAGKPDGQLSSCFLLDCEDTIKGIFNTKKEHGVIASKGGGTSICLNRVRPTGSLVSSTQRGSFGIGPLLESINKDSQMIMRGAVQRATAVAVWLSPWHPDFMIFLKAKGEKSPVDAKSLFYGIWLDDEFMQRVINDDNWWSTSDDLTGLYGDEFKQAYSKCKRLKTVKARELWIEILKEQCSARVPLYVMFNDTVNQVSNTKGLGSVLSSNLCCEIVEIATKDETAVCNLASLCLPKCVSFDEGGVPYFDFRTLKKGCYEMVHCLNNAINTTSYPTKRARVSNLKLAPLGIGVQGLHDTLVDLHLIYGSIEALEVWQSICEAMYYYCLKASCKLAKAKGKPHEGFEKTQLAQGRFHWEHFEISFPLKRKWESLRNKILKYGVVNSQLIALMPTATTSDLCGNSPSFEKYTSLIYKKRLAEHELAVVNKRLYGLLKDEGWWTPDIVEALKTTGSLPQSFYLDSKMGIDEYKYHIYQLFGTAYGDPYHTIDIAKTAQPFVDQAISLNWFINNATPSLLHKLYIYAWRARLKTASYYIHRSSNKKVTPQNAQPMVKQCLVTDPTCTSCSM